MVKKRIVILCGVLSLIALVFVACIPAFLDAQLVEAECEYSSGIDEIMIEKDTYFNGQFNIKYRFYHRPENETEILFVQWYTGEVYYDEESTPPLTQYTVEYAKIEDWISEQDNFYGPKNLQPKGFSCFVNVNDAKYFKICSEYMCYYQNFVLIVLPLYGTFMTILILLGLIGICYTYEN